MFYYLQDCKNIVVMNQAAILFMWR